MGEPESSNRVKLGGATVKRELIERILTAQPETRKGLVKRVINFNGKKGGELPEQSETCGTY